MQSTILRYGAAAAMALALGLGGCVHITNTYTGIPVSGESGSGARTAADRGSAASDCGCRGGGPGYYSQGYTPAPYQQNPYAGYYPPTYNSYPPQIYSEYPYSYYPAPYYPPQVYVPYGGYYGERPQGGGGEPSGGAPVRKESPRGGDEIGGSAPPRGYESRERRPAEPVTHRDQPVADGPGPVLEPRSGGRAPSPVDQRPRVDDGAPVVEATPTGSHERRPAVTGPNAYGGINPGSGVEPVASPRMPRADRSSPSVGDQDARPSSDMPQAEPRGTVGARDERTSPQSPESAEVSMPSGDRSPATSTGSRARREIAPAPVDVPVSHTSREVKRADAPVKATPTAAPTESPATAPAAATAPEKRVQAEEKHEVEGGSGPASSPSSRVRRREVSTDKVSSDAATSSESRERRSQSPGEARPVSVVSRPNNDSTSGSAAGTAGRSSTMSSPSVGTP